MLWYAAPRIGVAELVVVVLHLIGLIGGTAGQITVRHEDGWHADRCGVSRNSDIAESVLGGVVGAIQQAVLMLVVVQVAKAELVQRIGSKDMVIGQRDRLRAIILFVRLIGVAGSRHCRMTV